MRRFVLLLLLLLMLLLLLKKNKQISQLQDIDKSIINRDI